MSLNYEKHGNVLFITADGKYDKLLQKIDSTWDEERKVWITSKDNESLILKLQNEILKPGMKNISSQSKYIKEIDYDIFHSSSEEEEEEEEEKSRKIDDSSSEEDDTETKKYLQRRKQYEEISEKRKITDNKSKYKNNLKPPSSGKTVPKNSLKLSRSSSASSNNSLSSSSRSGSSSDDYPSPETPKRRVSYMKNNTRDYDTIVNKINDLQKEVSSLKKKIK